MKKLLLILALCMGYSCFVNAQTQTKAEVRQSMRRVADWQIARMKEVSYGDLNWVNATFYLGLSRWAAIAEQDNQDDSYYKWLMRLGRRNHWQVDQRMYHADDICISQTYLNMYKRYKQKEMIVPTLARAEWVIAHPSAGSFKLDYSDPTTLEHWTWCDALFMAPPVYLHLYSVTGDKKFIRFMDKEFKATYDYLFDKEENLFYRDQRYFAMKEANGAKVFWGRGNGWVLGGLVEMLRELPAKSKYRPFYQELFQKLCTRVAELQSKNGFWHASLLDPASYPSPETSCSGFFVYALAYGVNEGLLPQEKFAPVVEKGWQALLSAVEEDGKLGYVQPIGADPKKVTSNMTEVYGPGAFLLAGTEIYRMAREAAPKQAVNISQNRIQEIAAMLPDKPQGIGVSYKDRSFWDKMKESDEAKKLLGEEAPALLEKGMPPFVDSLYLHLNKTNVRLPGEVMMNARYHYLFRLSLAECIENKRRYVPAIEKALIALCEQKAWSIPAHDRSLQNYNGTDYYVDLVVATAGNGIVQCVTMLDDRLSPEVKARVLCAFREKMFRPVYRCLEETKPFWWFTITNNWNSVCLAGVTGAALALLPDKEERAYFVAAAEKYNVYGMQGYADDGYCSEGVGYYNYGFRAYILLREEVCRATQGKIDFFRHPKFVRITQYGKKIQMVNSLCPAYSDCRIGLSPDWFVTDYCDRALGIISQEEQYNLPASGNFSLHLIELFPNQAWKVAMTDEIRQILKEESDPLHAYYEKAGILIARPAVGSTCRMAVSAKGGNNAENHNHNDVGSYVVTLGKQTMAGDQGGPFSYPGDYFNADAPEKYKSKGSFGHPVPVVDGKTQSAGAMAQGIVLQKELTDGKDTFSIDYASAYSTPNLEKLVRTFIYDRKGEGNFTVGDEFTAKTPVRFETAITTRADWKILDDTHLLLTSGSEQMIVTIEASGKVEFTSETIEINAPAYTRIGIGLKGQSKGGYIRLMMHAKYS